jgi:signal transduction histidine kinase
MMLAVDLENRNLARVYGFTPEQVELPQGNSNVVALAIENARLNQQALHLAVMEERERLARDLHDSAMQSLYSICLYADAATKMLKGGKTEIAGEHLHEIHDLANEVLRDMRLFVFELHPSLLEQEGLVASLQARLKAVEARVGIQTELQWEGELELPIALAEELYRIAQEALNNVLKHAQARRVTVRLRLDPERACLEVCDDGIGYVPAVGASNGGLGLRGMKARVDRIGGELTIESVPGKGTCVRVFVRIHGEQA